MFSQSTVFFFPLSLLLNSSRTNQFGLGTEVFFSDKDAQKCHTRKVLPCFVFLFYLTVEMRHVFFLLFSLLVV